MIACERGHMLVAKYLVENGTDIHATEKSGDTALLWAAQSNHLDMVQYLVERCDVNVNIRNKVQIRY